MAFHCAIVGTEPWLLRNDRDVEIDELEFLAPDDAQNVREKLGTGNTFIARIGIRKMSADVALADRAQKRVHDRMEQNIGVRMAGQTGVMRNFDSAEDEFPATAKPVHVEAVADSIIVWHTRGREPLKRTLVCTRFIEMRRDSPRRNNRTKSLNPLTETFKSLTVCANPISARRDYGS